MIAVRHRAANVRRHPVLGRHVADSSLKSVKVLVRVLQSAVHMHATRAALLPRKARVARNIVRVRVT